MKRVLPLVILALVAALIAWRLTRTTRITPDPTTTAAPDRASPSSPTPPSAPAPVDAGTPQVRKLAKEDRQRLEAQIRAAIAKSTSTAGAAPSLGDELPVIPLEDVGKPLQQALEDAVPLLAACYRERKAGHDAIALMTLISDPELGTVIDTGEIQDEAGAKLETQLDACLRDTIDSLALPPLGKPGKVALQYSFKFEQP